MVAGRKQLSGCILDEEAGKVVEEMKQVLKENFVMGQSDGWKNITKTSLVASLINVEYMPYPLNTHDMSGLPKTAEQQLEFVVSKITYAVDILKVQVVVWCTDTRGDVAKMHHLLVKKMPHIVVVDCWAHQVCLHNL
ncbi:hypothetical protein PAXRUDRAFT_160608 [Paxillus rubicundulus Ve08.2h10]|uniref:DUF659 domain-containing protein n=1 Tax=Paxillus rubicundulus Ve08.2h10 TaxID=930991 RepID=A0A0D0DF92_9AGAM|nr:hypothetical protein PAXRUDRAFT_160608 [Paxillus rubicundulus Ve08.2h10]